MSTNNTYCLAQRVRAAVMLQPSLLVQLVNNRTNNPRIVESTLRRLLPYRTSIEIEHMGDYNKIQSIFDKVLLKQSKEELVHSKYDAGNNAESTISIYNPSQLNILYTALNILQNNASVDEDGSIHIHVDITKWLDTNSNIKLAGINNLIRIGTTNEVFAFYNEILTKASDIVGLVIDKDKFSFETGLLIDKPKYYDNVRAISYEVTYGHSRMDYWSEHKLLTQMDSDDYHNAIQERRRNNCPATAGKRNWINFRFDFKSIEIRTFPCSFDYTTIVEYMIESNKLVKRILQICEYLGNKAIKANNSWLK